MNIYGINPPEGDGTDQNNFPGIVLPSFQRNMQSNSSVDASTSPYVPVQGLPTRGEKAPQDINWNYVFPSQVVQNLGQTFARSSSNSYQNAVQRFNQEQFNPLNYLPYSPNNSNQALYGYKKGGIYENEGGLYDSTNPEQEMENWIMQDSQDSVQVDQPTNIIVDKINSGEALENVDTDAQLFFSMDFSKKARKNLNFSRQTNPGFRSFSTYEEGKQALINQLELYKTGRTRNPVSPSSTLQEAMSVYAPASDNNNPVQYAKFIADKLGISSDTPISQIDTRKWADAVEKFEGNTKGNNPGNIRYPDGGTVPYGRTEELGATAAILDGLNYAIVSGGNNPTKDRNVRYSFNKVREMYGDQAARDLMTKASIYSQREDRKYMTPEQRVASFYEMYKTDPIVGRLASVGYGPEAFYKDSPNTNVQDSMVANFKKGGIYIKEENKGKFTDYCGGKVTAECIARGKSSSNPVTRKRANFAANSRKWKHQDGGLVEGQEYDLSPDYIEYLRSQGYEFE